MTDSSGLQQREVVDDIDKVNVALSAWAARSATESDALIERLEAMGYEIRGKSEDEIADILKRPPARPPR